MDGEIVLRLIPNNRCVHCGGCGHVEHETMLCMRCYQAIELRRRRVEMLRLRLAFRETAARIQKTLVEFNRETPKPETTTGSVSLG